MQPKDQRKCSWAFFKGSRGVTKSDVCERLSCTKCGKFDELEVLRRDIVQLPIKFASKDDYIASEDGVIFVSDKLKDLLKGCDDFIELLSIPQLDGYSVCIPARCLEIQLAKCGMEFHRKCSVCGRYRETCLAPTQDSFCDLPTFSMAAPAVLFEHVQSRAFWFVASDEFAEKLATESITGLYLAPV